MHIHIQFANGQLIKAPIVQPPTSIAPSRHLFQSTMLGTRIQVTSNNDAKVIGGVVLRADIATNGLGLALLDNGAVLGWSDVGAWGVSRAPSSEPYYDPNWQFPYTPGSPIPNNSVTPAFPSTPSPPPDVSWTLAFVTEDAVVVAARAATDEWLTKSPLPLRRIERKGVDSAIGPWLFLPLVGSYEERGGEWAGWIEDEARSWIAFIQCDGAGLVWKERGVGGEVEGDPTVFSRDVATFPLLPTPRRRGAVKKIRVHRGIEIHIDRPMGTVIEGTGPDGKGYIFEQRCDYGFFPNTLGDDFDEFDVYMGPNPLAANVFIIEQLRAKSGWWDERKAIVGCDSAEEALELYKSHVHPRMVGRIGKMTHEAFEQALRVHQKTYSETKKSARVPFVPVTQEDAAELAEMEALRAALEATWLMLDDAKGGTPHDLKTTEPETDNITNFPNQGDNRTVTLRNSKFERFDVDWAADMQKNHPKVWALATNSHNNKQFGIIARAQRQGGAPHTSAEELTIRLRETWAGRHYEETRVPGIVAQTQWAVVGRLGEQRMKDLINKEKEKRSDKVAATEDRAPLSYPPPSDDFNPPDDEPSSVQPISTPPPSSIQNPMAVNAQPNTTDPMMVLPPMPPAKDVSAASGESGLDGKDTGPLSTRAPNLQPQSTKAMPNATQDRLHHLVHRIVTATLALSAIGALTIPTDERDAFRRYISGAGPDAPGVPQHKDANPSGVSGRPGQNADGLMRRRVMEIRATESIADIDPENREITFIASTPSVDSHGEVVMQDWIFDRFEKNPVILWAHNQREPPIGRAVKWWVENGKTLYIRVRFSQVYAFAQLIFDMILEETIRACSVGFIPHEIGRQEIDGQMRTVLRRNELCELSVCPVPSNADAVIPKELENALAERYERCAAELERRIAAFDPKSNSNGNNHNATPVNGEGVGGPSTRQRAPAAAPANPSAAPTSGGPSRGKTMTIIDQKYAREQVRREGTIAHRCGNCGTDTPIQLSGVREHIIELEAQRDGLEQKHALALTKLEAEEIKRKAVERERDELRVKQTEIELAGLIGPDAWNITPVEARQFAETRVRHGEDAYQTQLASRKEHLARVKQLADEVKRLTNAPAAPPPPVAGQAPPTVMGGLNAASAPAAPAQPTTKVVDPTISWLSS
jgi:HK97 family phage prohead protease